MESNPTVSAVFRALRRRYRSDDETGGIIDRVEGMGSGNTTVSVVFRTGRGTIPIVGSKRGPELSQSVNQKCLNQRGEKKSDSIVTRGATEPRNDFDERRSQSENGDEAGGVARTGQYGGKDGSGG